MSSISTAVTGAVGTVGFVFAIITFYNTVAFYCTSCIIAACDAIFTIGLIRAIFAVIIAVATIRAVNAFLVCTLELVEFAPLRDCCKRNQTITNMYVTMR